MRRLFKCLCIKKRKRRLIRKLYLEMDIAVKNKDTEMFVDIGIKICRIRKL